MKFMKILSVLMVVCMLGTAMIACSKEGKADETTAASTETAVSINVTLVIKDGSTEKARAKVPYEGTNPTLGKIIDNYCAGEGYEGEAFDDKDMLAAIGDLKRVDGKRFLAYYEVDGEGKEFDSIKNQPVKDGDVIVVALK